MNMSERTQKYKGKYRPHNPQKYIGDPSNIIYRSMWERKCMKYFDNNPSVIKWSSEEKNDVNEKKSVDKGWQPC